MRRYFHCNLATKNKKRTVGLDNDVQGLLDDAKRVSKPILIIVTVYLD